MKKIVINIENSEFEHTINNEPRIEIKQTNHANSVENIERQETPNIPEEMNSEF